MLLLTVNVTCWRRMADRDDAGENADVTAWLHRV
jgi:hypothetical protein